MKGNFFTARQKQRPHTKQNEEMAFENYQYNAPPSPSSPLSTKSHHLRTSADLQSVGSIKLTPEELARIDASLTNFFQQHLATTAPRPTTKLRKESSVVMPMEMEEIHNNNQSHNNNIREKESFMRIGENDLENLSLKTDRDDFWGGGGGWKTSPNAYNVPQTDPFKFQQNVPETPRTTSSMRVMPPTPPITNNQQKEVNSSSPFPLDMRAFEDMKRLYEERIQLIEVLI